MIPGLTGFTVLLDAPVTSLTEFLSEPQMLGPRIFGLPNLLFIRLVSTDHRAFLFPGWDF